MRYFILISLAIMLSCASTRSGNAVTEIRYGTSFGHCRGYCYNEYIHKPEGIVHIRKGWDTAAYPRTMEAIQSPEGHWNALIKNLDEARFFALEPRIGCPDCADQGAEWVEVVTDKKRHKVLFEYGQNPDGLAPLLALLRN